jgi:hypothetical protein
MKIEIIENGVSEIRNMSKKELDQVSKDKTDFDAKFADETAKAEAKATARQVILDRLGLNADEAAILLG